MSKENYKPTRGLPRCLGTDRGRCWMPLKTPEQLMRKRCGECFIEWITNLQNVIIMYHSPCTDGFTAAWVARKVFGDRAQYIPCQHGEEVKRNHKRGANIFMLDFSYNTFFKMSKVVYGAASFHLLDHHITAKELFEKREWAYFDMERSGAMLTWDYFFGPLTAPLLVQYVQDRDLWNWKLNDSKAISSAINSYSFDFGTWDLLEGIMESNSSQIKSDGQAIERFVIQTVKEICDHATLVTMNKHKVPVVNTALLQSEVGAELLVRYPDVPFSASFFYNGTSERVWSFRSRKNEFNVGTLAASLGGGGHASAAGFTEKTSIKVPGGV